MRRNGVRMGSAVSSGRWAGYLSACEKGFDKGDSPCDRGCHNFLASRGGGERCIAEDTVARLFVKGHGDGVKEGLVVEGMRQRDGQHFTCF